MFAQNRKSCIKNMFYHFFITGVLFGCKMLFRRKKCRIVGREGERQNNLKRWGDECGDSLHFFTCGGHLENFHFCYVYHQVFNCYRTIFILHHMRRTPYPLCCTHTPFLISVLFIQLSRDDYELVCPIEADSRVII